MFCVEFICRYLSFSVFANFDGSAINSLTEVSLNIQNYWFHLHFELYRKLITIIVVAVLIIALLGSSLLSYVTFNVGNPFSASIGYFQVTVLDKDYVEISEEPKVMLAQPNMNILINYMKSRGFTEVEDEQMGAILVFTNGEQKECVHYSMNKYCSKWYWE